MSTTHSSKLPNEPIFRRLLKNSKTIPNVIIHDPTCDAYADYPKLLRDIVVFRQQLYDVLPDTLFDDQGIICADSPYILVVSPGNYEFVVAGFAILALGGAVVPIGTVFCVGYSFIVLDTPETRDPLTNVKSTWSVTRRGHTLPSRLPVVCIAGE